MTTPNIDTSNTIAIAIKYYLEEFSFLACAYWRPSVRRVCTMTPVFPIGSIIKVDIIG